MNNFLFNYFAKKIKERSIGERIFNIYAHEDTLFLNLKNNLAILFKLNSPTALFFGNYKLEKTQNNFAVSLHKKISGLRIIEVDFVGLERVLTLHLLDKRLDIEHHYYLIFEITGRNGNLLLCDNAQKIIEVFRLNQKRQIIPGKIYKKPPQMLDVTLSDINTLKNAIKKENILGIDSFTKNFINEENLENFIETIKKPSDRLFCYTYNKKKFVYPFLLNFGLDTSAIEENELFEQFFKQNTNINSNNTKIINFLDKKIKKLSEKIEKIQSDIKKAEDAQTFKLYADTLLENISKLKYINADIIYLKPLEKPNELAIPINPQKTIQDNINHYYKLYKKYKNAKSKLENVLKNAIKEQKFLLKIKENLLSGHIDPNYIKTILPHNNAQKIVPLDNIPYEHFNILGFDVYIGKNAKGNDLILKNASKDDIWMHTKSIPGPHLIIKNPQRLQQLDKTLLEKCAQKIRENLGTNDKIEVDYTFVKFVKKPKGFKKGRVTYSNFKTVVVG
ncbi:hypothetical protein DESACE_01455 [Desulfurella acetivorans A63]|nr:hypothetical protein DESACE_01455 [Desulfurella acetivorans A63]